MFFESLFSRYFLLREILTQIVTSVILLSKTETSAFSYVVMGHTILQI